MITIEKTVVEEFNTVRQLVNEKCRKYTFCVNCPIVKLCDSCSRGEGTKRIEEFLS